MFINTIIQMFINTYNKYNLITLLIIVFPIISFIPGYSKEEIPKIEIQFKLIEEVNVITKAKDIALSESIINHSNENIYIPRFRIRSFVCIVLYKKVGEEYKKINLLGEGNGCTFDSSGVIVYGRTYYNNVITKRFNDICVKLERIQDKRLRKFVKNNTEKSLEDWTEHLDQPLLLKKKEKLRDFEVINLNHLYKDKADYRISFDFEKPDSTNSPKYMLQYKRYVPATILSNTIYCSTK